MLDPQIPADPLINHGPHRSPFAANFQYTAARDGGRGHASTTRTASRRAIGQLAPDTRKDIGVPVREVTLQLRSE